MEFGKAGEADHCQSQLTAGQGACQHIGLESHLCGSFNDQLPILYETTLLCCCIQNSYRKYYIEFAWPT